MNQNGKSILIVEDSPTQALSLKHMLEREGLHVLHAADGKVGIEMAKKYLPDAVVLDIEMPEVNGYEAAVQLSTEEDTAHIPVIMLTTHDTVNAAQKGILLGAVDFIPKDIFADAVLLETLRQLQLLANEKGIKS